jgi:lipoprotein-anchoring transpeptidase ErfK/SrfK
VTDDPNDPTGEPPDDPSSGEVGPDGGPEDGPVGFRVEQVDGGPVEVQRRPHTRRIALVIAALAALAVVGVGSFALTRGGDPPPTTTTSTSTSTTTSTTISPAVVVATATQPSIQVSAEPPADWDTATTAVRYGPPPPPSSAAELAASGEALPPLPRDDYPIAGRQVTPAGWVFSNPTSLGDPFVMLVTERRGDHLQVQVPVRPNGTVGYVRADEVELTTQAQRIELDVSDRRLRFLDGDVVVAETDVVVGTDDTRTPTGRFYVTDQVPQDNPDGSFGPLVLATSAYSEQLDEFDDGAPVVALHGTNKPELIGSAASNGCVRMPNDVITLIGDRLQLGARVDITP